MDFDFKGLLEDVLRILCIGVAGGALVLGGVLWRRFRALNHKLSNPVAVHFAVVGLACAVGVALSHTVDVASLGRFVLLSALAASMAKIIWTMNGRST